MTSLMDLEFDRDDLVEQIMIKVSEGVTPSTALQNGT